MTCTATDGGIMCRHTLNTRVPRGCVVNERCTWSKRRRRRATVQAHITRVVQLDRFRSWPAKHRVGRPRTFTRNFYN